MGCYVSGDFSRHFKENMTDLGLTVPSGLFESYDKAINTASSMVGTLHTLGNGATVAELVGATTGAEALMVLGALQANYYVGAVIGSIAVASGRSLSCGTRISDLFTFMEQNPNLKFDQWHKFFNMHPEILETSRSHRRTYAVKAKLHTMEHA